MFCYVFHYKFTRFSKNVKYATQNTNWGGGDHLLTIYQAMKNLFLSIIFVALFAFSAFSQTIIAAKDAAKHMGKLVTITEKVCGGKLMESGLTILNIGSLAPKPELTVTIPAADRSKFKGKPEEDYKGKDVTVSGKVVTYNGKPAIMVTDPKQLKVVLIDNTKGTLFKQN
jgi:hypothetical protein